MSRLPWPTEAGTLDAPAELDEPIYHIARTLPSVLKLADDIQDHLASNAAVIELLETAQYVVNVVVRYGLTPFAQEHGPAGLWDAGVKLARFEHRGFQTLGTLLQLKALRETPGMDNALVRLLEERLRIAVLPN